MDAFSDDEGRKQVPFNQLNDKNHYSSKESRFRADSYADEYSRNCPNDRTEVWDDVRCSYQ